MLETLNLVLQAVAVFLLFAGFVIGTATIAVGLLLTKRQEAVVAGLELQIAQQQERAAKAETALVELQRRLAWRSIGDADAEPLIPTLANFAGTNVRIGHVGDPEAAALAERVTGLLSRAGWTVLLGPNQDTLPRMYGIVCSGTVGSPAMASLVSLLFLANRDVRERQADSWSVFVAHKGPA